MKTLFNSSKLAAAILFLSMTVSLSSFANEGDNEKEGVISYVGNLNELPVYRLSLQNEKHGVFFISVTDSEGNRIYNEKLSGVNIVRNYQFRNESNPEYQFTFIIADKNGKEISKYHVSKVKKVVEQVAVSEVK